MDSVNVCPNPWCTCDPCRCEQPCTCGLRANSHGQTSRWDANTSTLHHVVTTTFRRHPDGEQPGSGPHGEAHSELELSMLASNDVAAALDSGDTGALAAYSRRVASGEREGHGHGGPGAESHASIRRATHLGHDIEVQTSYKVTVNGRELVGHVGVDDDGITHYHGLPNYQTASALELVKQIVEQFPRDFPPSEGDES